MISGDDGREFRSSCIRDSGFSSGGIVFEVGKTEEIDGFTAETIVLLTIGTHDVVY